MFPLEYLLLISAALVLLSILIAKFTDNLGIPSLLLFLSVGMLAGSEGPGGIAFADADLARSIGTIALIFILFSGGLETQWVSLKPILYNAVSLSTLGVLLTAFTTGLFLNFAFAIPFLESILFGSIISSTDASAVFSVLKTRSLKLKPHISSLLELESGSNDPMAIFLTIGIIEFIKTPSMPWHSFVLLFVLQMGIGGIFGIGLGRLIIQAINRLKFSASGLYPVFLFAGVILIYAAASVIGGSGFLAVYCAGLVASQQNFVQKKTLSRFFDGFAWLGQVTMFLTLGLLVFPHKLADLWIEGLVVALFLIFAARPVSVLVSTLFSSLRLPEKLLISWGGLRGAVPIIIATFPLMENIPGAEHIFNLVFFIVLFSALMQGWSIPFVARLFRLDDQSRRQKKLPIEFNPETKPETEMVDIYVPPASPAAGKSIVELELPKGTLIVMISRDEAYIVPDGSTVLEERDTLIVLVRKELVLHLQSVFLAKNN